MSVRTQLHTLAFNIPRFQTYKSVFSRIVRVASSSTFNSVGHWPFHRKFPTVSSLTRALKVSSFNLSIRRVSFVLLFDPTEYSILLSSSG